MNGDPETISEPPLAELERELAAEERRAGVVRPGAAKRIVWHHPARRQPTALCLVYIHGFSASRGEIAPVCDRMARCLGANLFYTRLTGHGQGGASMARATTADWLADARRAVGLGRRLGRRVVLFGTSTGGTLAAWAAAQPDMAPHIAALVLMSPNFGPRHPLAGLLQYGCVQARLRRTGGRWRSTPAANAGHAAVWTLRYPWIAALPMLRLVRTARRIDPARIRQPVLLFYHPSDRVVRVGRMRRFYRRLGSPVRQRFCIRQTGHPGRHILAGDIFAPGMTGPVADRGVAFVRAAVGA